MTSPRSTGQNQQERYTHGHGKAVTKFLGQRTAFSHAAFFLPYLQPGLRLLDCGCGPGSITIDLAEIVTSGEVVGIDISESQIEQARNSAKERGISNVRFETANINELPFPENSFDAIFSHAVLEHLGNPLGALKEMCRVLKSGGILGVRDADRMGEIFWPQSAIIERSDEILNRLWQQNGGDPFIGRKLRSMLNSAGLVDVQASASYEYHGSSESVQEMAKVTINYISGALADPPVKLDLMNREEIDSTIDAFQEWGKNPDAFWARSWCEAVGRKE